MSDRGLWGLTPDEKASVQQTDYNSKAPDRQEVRKADVEAGRSRRTWSALNDAILG